MDGVDAGNEVEEMAALIAAEEDMLGGEFAPCDPLACEEDDAESDGGGEPGKCAAGDRFADAEPLVHDVVFAEHVGGGPVSMVTVQRRSTAVLSQRMRGMTVGTHSLT